MVAIEYLSDDPPEKIIAYYKDQLKKYGDVLECHNNSNRVGAAMNPGDHAGHSERLKCEGDQNGQTVELKVGNEQSQHIASIKPGDEGKGSDSAWSISRCGAARTPSERDCRFQIGDC